MRLAGIFVPDCRAHARGQWLMRFILLRGNRPVASHWPLLFKLARFYSLMTINPVGYLEALNLTSSLSLCCLVPISRPKQGCC